MRVRLLVALLAPLLLSAEMKLFVVRQGIEQAAGSTYDVGSIAAGEALHTQFRVRNAAVSAAWLQGLNLAGSRFSFASLPKLPLLLGPGEASEFVVRFQPLAPISYTAYLNINGIRTVLTGTGGEPKPVGPPPPVEPPSPPKPSVTIEPAALKGGQQAKVAIRLASLSQVSTTGELRMEFKPSVAGKSDDAAVLFPATGSRTISFMVTKGEGAAKFGGRTDTEFQTGTTAGDITFTATLGAHKEQLVAQVPRAPVVINSARTARAAGGIDVQVTGYDTSRSASLISFTFFDLDGHVVSPGTIQADASRAFQQYFEATNLGSMFALRALFPVQGDSSRIGWVDVELSNSLGDTRTGHVAIQ
ncbi:MAG TPA: hypothetical protein VLH09_12525 [Bryobacteraceae bacterium]|nr:hypothetical protein [Bryobacteraceae bacterium]